LTKELIDEILESIGLEELSQGELCWTNVSVLKRPSSPGTLHMITTCVERRGRICWLYHTILASRSQLPAESSFEENNLVVSLEVIT